MGRSAAEVTEIKSENQLARAGNSGTPGHQGLAGYHISAGAAWAIALQIQDLGLTAGHREPPRALREVRRTMGY